MGSKIEAKRRVREFDVPTVPGYDGDDQSPATLRARGRAHRLSAADQGERGRRRPRHARRRVGRARSTRRSTRRSAKRWRRSATTPCCSSAICAIRATSSSRSSPTRTATSIHLGERECSIQRRHQKIVEEAPSVALTPRAARRDGRGGRARREVGRLRERRHVRVHARRDGTFYFLEMNTRLQVEHPVTELVYGIDLVRWQLRIAVGRAADARAGRRARRAAGRSRRASTPRIRRNDMLPSTGTIARWSAAARARRARRRRRRDRQRGERTTTTRCSPS